MKIFIASIGTETNTFASIPTGMASFEASGLYRGDGSSRAPGGVGSYVHHMRSLAEAEGLEVAESLAAWAVPCGNTVRSVWETLRDALLEDLRAAMPVDIVQLALHGAMVADGYDDCEGDLLARIRALVGPEVAIGAELDLHCHFTEQMRASADAIIAFKHYPHVDWRERADELFRILVDTAAGRVSPVTAVFDCKMVGFFHTTREPMASFVKAMEAIEGEQSILSVSLGHGFPCGDTAENGAKLWVVADRDKAAAEALAEHLGRAFWNIREETCARSISCDAALNQATASSATPIVLADIADNPGGGAPGDSTFILKAMIERGIGNAAIGGLWDPGAIAICRVAGIGADLNLRVGGKCGPTSGDPLDLRVKLLAFSEDHAQHGYQGRMPFGPSAWVRTESGVDILIVSSRNQIKALDAFTGLGINLADKQIIVVKSAQHFRDQFEAIAADILYVATPGAVPADFTNIPFVKRSLDYWPRVADPHHAESAMKQETEPHKCDFDKGPFA